MYSPKELEGEVDHAFFDSDCEDDSKDTGKDSRCLDDGNGSKQDPTQSGSSGPEGSSPGGFSPVTALSPRERERKEDDSVAENGKGNKVGDETRARDEDASASEDGSRERKDDGSRMEDGSRERKKEDGSGMEDASEEIKDISGVVVRSRAREEAGSEKEDGSVTSNVTTLLSCGGRSEIRMGSQSDEVASAHSNSSVEIATASSAEEGEPDDDDDVILHDKEDDDEDGYHRSGDESEEEDERPPEPRLPRYRGAPLGTPKKATGKFRSHSRSSSSSSDLDSSCSSGGSCSSEPAPERRAPSISQTTSSPRRRPRLGSPMRRERPRAPQTPESEDTVTDVTPLSTPDCSPVQSFDLPLLTEPGRVVTRQPQHDVTMDLSGVDLSSDRPGSEPEGEERSGDVQAGGPGALGGEESGWGGLVSQRAAAEPADLNQLLTAFLNVESSVDTELLMECPGGRNRKNFSFTNDEVRRIDRENQRLLRELSRPSPGSRSGSTAPSSTQKSPKRPSAPPVRLYHTALNRQREQQRIERENLLLTPLAHSTQGIPYGEEAFLKRLESVKPTPGMTRTEQLADYQRQARYLGTPAPLSTFDSSLSKLERSPSNRTSPGKSSRPCSATSRHSARPASSIPARSGRASAPRPAWS